MRRIISAILFYTVKYLSLFFYRFDIEYFGDVGNNPWRGVRLIVFLNHTSLFEPIFLTILPNWYLWDMSKKLVAPGADKTLNRPFVGLFYRFLSPGMVSISRKRDSTWSDFLEVVGGDCIVGILPEGRMKRRTGLDALGKPMNIRAGVGDVVDRMSGGRMAICYSAGLHHIQAPGEWPRFFKTVRGAVEFLDIDKYKRELGAGSIHEFKLAVVSDLEERQRKNTPVSPKV